LNRSTILHPKLTGFRIKRGTNLPEYPPDSFYPMQNAFWQLSEADRNFPDGFNQMSDENNRIPDDFCCLSDGIEQLRMPFCCY